VIFVALNVLPGSPASTILGNHATPAAVAELNRRAGFDHPVYVRYLQWLGGLFQGNLGKSAVVLAEGSSNPSIWYIIRWPLANTATLATVAALILIPLSLLLGLWAAVRRGRVADHVVSVSTLVMMCMPEFVTGAILIAVFFVALGLLPPVSLLNPGAVAIAHPRILILPVLTLLTVAVAWAVRLVRVGAIEVLDADYVQAARLAGLRERKVLRAYVLRNALGPSVQIFALSFQYLFGGVVVVETVFNYPGLGMRLINAVNTHDNSQIESIAMIFATVYILTNIVADVVLILLVPKLRAQKS